LKNTEQGMKHCLVAIVIFGCANSATAQPYLKLLDAKFERSNSGIPGQRETNEYYFQFRILSPKKIDFDTFYSAHGASKSYLANSLKLVSDKPATVRKGDTVIVRVSEELPYLPQNESGKKASKFRKGEGKLRYLVDNKINFISLNRIQEFTGTNRP
jgi:hypothetical protein